MKTFIINFIFGIFCSFAVLFSLIGLDAVHISATEQLEKTADRKEIICQSELPSGYFLQKNKYGNYRPMFRGTNSPVFWTQDSGTRCEAIMRAWRQYDYEQGKINNIDNWEIAK